jgi:exonuclease I
MPKKQVKINRAPVLTLWGTVVAERLGYDHQTALTLGKAVAGLNAQSKGRRLGIFHEAKDDSQDGDKENKEKKASKAQEQSTVTVLGRAVPTVRTADGIRAAIKGDPIEPQSVQRYLAQKFGEDLDDAQAAMEALAKAYPPKKLAGEAFELYEEFRPSVPEGEKGWGAKGTLDLEKIRSLAK